MSKSSQSAGFGSAASADAYGSLGGSVESTGRWVRSTAKWLETSEDTDPAHFLTFCCEDFKPRKLKAPLVLIWLSLQALGLLFQLSLFLEASRHLSDFEDTLAAYCSAEHQRNGICLGPNWNLSYSGMLNFPPMQGEDSRSDFDFVIPADRSFSFKTTSRPATFLLGVEPQAPHAKARWKAGIAMADQTQTPVIEGSSFIPSVFGTGNKYKVIVGPLHASGDWTGSLNLKSQFSDSTDIRIYVVDSMIQHLEDVHSQPQCSFEDSWQNFNERHNGDHHKILTFTQRATGFFLLVSVVTFALMGHRFYFYVEGGKLLSRVIALKFLVQDFPQQLLIVTYLYAWYAENGLRCQMCLFHPQHCDEQYPLHFSNLLVCIFTLLSASSNQLLLQAKSKRYDEEEECFMMFARGTIFSVSVLPFSTGLFFLSSSLFHLRSALIYFLAGIPTLVGWGALLCVPMFTLCEDDMIV
jgi:hypothetical protein